MIKSIHLNNHTICRPFDSAIDKMISCLREDCTGQADSYLESLREQFGVAENDRVYFSSSGEEAISQVFLSAYTEVVRRTGKNHFLTASAEESAIVNGLKWLEKIDCFFQGDLGK